MAAANPQSKQDEELQILPVHCVTAIFETQPPLPEVTAELKAAGFKNSDIEVLVGEEGAKRLDAKPDEESPAQFFLQAVTKALADDAEYLERAAGKIRKGGAMIRIPVADDDEPAAQRATNILKARGGQQVQHWKEWTTEQL